jgi:aspartate aminotransferase
VTPKTRAIMLNSPSNPTGAVYNRAVAGSAREGAARDIPRSAITDDIYRKLVYGVE